MKNEKWIMVYMMVGRKPDLERIGPYYSDDLQYAANKIIPWLERVKGCTQVDICSVIIPEKSYYSMIPPSPDLPSKDKITNQLKNMLKDKDNRLPSEYD